MAKAKRVHSTPRKTASKSKRTNAPKSTESADAERARLYGSLENPVCECARMAEIAMDAHSSQAGPQCRSRIGVETRTIERSMFPPRADERSVLEFPKKPIRQ